MSEGAEPQIHISTVNIHYPNNSVQLNRIEAVLAAIIAKVKEIAMTDQAIQAGIDQLKSDVTALTDANNSAITLINGFAAQLAAAVQAAKDSGASPEQLQALTDFHTAIETDTTALASAVTANTAVLAAPDTPAASPSGDAGATLTTGG